MKIKEKIKRWLWKEELEQLQEINQKLDDSLNSLKLANNAYLNGQNKLYDAASTYDNYSKLLDRSQELINKFLDVGVDIGMRTEDHSWAVVCVQGKPEYVKFMPLSNQDVRSVIGFLRQFKYSNRQTDSPFGYKGMIEDLIFKFD
jgi:hypothetical protein